ncbi:small RNA-binding protein 11, chloroplastic-like [Typha latifolia]|uniref:small RNA-binding protein 11, chloroplastic-like n=1 Tax=Typha latifolia TaxID=4733 RepID=UPI003C2B4B87
MWALRTATPPKLLLRRGFSSEIFVSRLSHYITDEEFREAFSPFGTIKEARLIRDGKTQRPKGFGFIAYASVAEAQKAIKAMDGRIFGGRLIFVEPTKPSSE